MTIATASSTWGIGLSAWIIQDGNYPDFAIGQTVEFAVEFRIVDKDQIRNGTGSVAATNVCDCLYETTAEVVMQTSDITVLDIGILVYCEPSGHALPLPLNEKLAVRLELGVDPFFYFERLNRVPNVPPMVYSWNIRSISRQTAPFIETIAQGGALDGRKVMMRDSQGLGSEDILKTDAWNDDGGLAEYVLHCELLPVAPKRLSTTAL